MNIFEGLPEFLAVAEGQSFTAAARRLDVSTSLVSRRIAALEKRLGVQLVARTTRRVRLTDAGREYQQRCAEMMQRLEETNQLVSGQMAELDGLLRVSVAGAFAEHHIVPALSDFAQMHHHLTLEIDFNTRLVNFVDEGIDFAVRLGTPADSTGLVARKLCGHGMAAAASPDYFRRFGHPETPLDLRRHQCLFSPGYERWRFETQDGEQEVHVSGQWRSNNASAIVTACCRGMGIAYMNSSSFGGAIEDGSLVTTLEPYWAHGRSSWIVYPSRKYLPSRARRAVEFLLERFKDSGEP